MMISAFFSRWNLRGGKVSGFGLLVSQFPFHNHNPIMFKESFKDTKTFIDTTFSKMVVDCLRRICRDYIYVHRKTFITDTLISSNNSLSVHVKFRVCKTCIILSEDSSNPENTTRQFFESLGNPDQYEFDVERVVKHIVNRVHRAVMDEVMKENFSDCPIYRKAVEHVHPEREFIDRYVVFLGAVEVNQQLTKVQ
jgi:hypothetical protein